MTRDDIERMAKNEYGIYAFTAKSLAHFADLVAAAERERWEKFCSELAGAYFLESQNEKGKAALEIANLICEDAIFGGDEEDGTTHN